ncbi:MAG: SDR family NAD(P)-dependent oxidoreductase [Ignavibacteria bacterium]|nr:SDR family NAD(P)-dependent oxidoreductase [Ignavibacteria bacterium]
MKEKIVIVTGGTGALGRYIVNKFAAEGNKVYVPVLTMKEFNDVFNDKSNDNDNTDFSLKKIYAFECNATDKNSVKEFVSSVARNEKDKIDFLINTVGGIGKAAKVSETDYEDFDELFNLNFKSTFYFSKECLSYMIENKFGRIISIGALAALETSPSRFSYGYAKYGVINLMNTISEENKENNIFANTVIPSIIDTPANREWGSEEDIKKWVTPEELSSIIFDLTTEKNKSIRNSVIQVLNKY